ncbi:MAG: efflux RND transporter periplasmic adaptor subunit [Gammaproteobacteria bacterium]|nr:efflux RND transporter periplasmic adaptor subunit [Gammaproteobacteria bacterium]
MRTGAVLLVQLLCGCLLLSACDRKTPATSPQWIPVRVQTLGALTDEDGVRYSASVTPETQLDLKFKASGYIDSIYQTRDANGKLQPVPRGTSVNVTTELAHIKDDEYRDKVKVARANLAAAEASLVKAKQDFKRAKELYASESMTAPDYDSAQQEYSTAVANVDGARAQLDEAQQVLAYCTLVPPMDGVILSRNIELGALVDPATVAFVLADMSAVKVIFAVPDVMLKNITLGDVLNVTTQSHPGTLYSGKVTTISPAADSKTRVFEIEITIPNPQGELKDGMVAALKVPELPAHVSTALAVPISAVVRSKKDPQGYALYVVESEGSKSIAHLQEVQLGDVHGNRIAVLGGVSSGQQVIVSGVTTVWDGGQVRIVQ